ncbi:MAG: di-trans,poly-cis-decaprenylcistransferase [Clostridia bacterium]|nr:di-trans,poly-cis-decaprenylcistransferase [Clostridia bacterium]
MFVKNNTTKIYKKLDLARLPNHIAIIMDGNGRWATRRGLPRSFGHKAGCENLKRIVENLTDLGIKNASFFTFSTENWKRPKEEIDAIFNAVREYLNEDTNILIERGIKVTYIGNISNLPEDLIEAFKRVMNETKNCDKMTLNLAINYSGRDEILRATNKAIEQGEILDEQGFNKCLDLPELPDPDFVIRTSGELRISNFMLYQMAYSELYFTKTLWPDFCNKELQKALINFQKRDRRFGGLKK